MEEETFDIKKVRKVHVIDKRNNKTICDGNVEKFDTPIPKFVDLHLDTGYKIVLTWENQE